MASDTTPGAAPHEVVGIDRRSGGRYPWVCVHLREGRLHAFRGEASWRAAIGGAGTARRIAVNVALGGSTDGRRALAARVDEALGPGAGWWRRNADDETVRETALGDDRVVEVVPELTLQEMLHLVRPEAPAFQHAPGTWEGLHERLEVLHAHGLRPSRSYGGVGLLTPGNVLYATAAAWTAWRVENGTARRVESRTQEGGLPQVWV